MQWPGAHTDDYSVALSTYGEGVYLYTICQRGDAKHRHGLVARPGLGTGGSRPKLRCSTAPSFFAQRKFSCPSVYACGVFYYVPRME